MAEHTAYSARLAWSRQDGSAVLHDAHPDMDALVADLTAIVRDIPEGGVLPGLSTDFPPPGEAPDKLRLTRPALAEYASRVSTTDGPAGERWLGALVTDLSVDDRQRADISLFTAPSGKQSMRTMLDKPLALLRGNPGLMREALLAWRRYPSVSGEYLDHRVLFDSADAADGKPSERGVPGATWLALMSYPLMRTTAADGRPMSTCWQDFGRRVGHRMVYPLWSAPLAPAAVQAVLSHPVLQGAESGRPPELATLLSMFWIGHASRRRIPGRTFAGMLTPTSQPTRPVVRPGLSRRAR
uniref:type I-G CRISPR-associated protein, Cas3-extension family n=1 Tax=Pseudonocardia asaccharolytica TaxID=54010 RepID=UPI0011BE752D|nr:hypothetical protein [Pseudonocardia asaccharolytica]